MIADNLGQIQPLRELLLEDIRDIDDQCVQMLSTALVTTHNHTLHSIEVTESLQQTEAWDWIIHCLDLNWSGSRVLLERHFCSQDESCFTAIPLSLWPLVMERVNFPARYGMTSRTPHAPNVLYYLIREGLLILMPRERFSGRC